MNSFEKKKTIFLKHSNAVKDCYKYYVQGSIPEKIIGNAKMKYANGVEKNTVIGLFDTTLFNNGKEGMLFTDNAIYIQEVMSKPIRIKYSEIDSMVLKQEYKKDEYRNLDINLKNGKTVEIMSCGFYKSKLIELITELIEVDKDASKQSAVYDNEGDYSDETDIAATTAGVVLGNISSASTNYTADKLQTPKGHGFAAEQANHFEDKIRNVDIFGNKVKLVGNDNAKDGPDRIVNGVEIQTKYCRTGSKCIEECFDKGKYRYIDSSGKPMAVEVPKNKYADAVAAMERRIKNNEVPGVSDPKEAKNLVRKGYYTYEQARNIAKAGNIDSILYDSKTGTVTAISAMGVSGVISFATALWNGDDFEVALDKSVKVGLRAGGTAFATAVLTSQLSKAGLNSALVASSETLVNIMGPKASAVMVNAFRGGTNIYGAAAMKSASKMLRGNAITAGVSVVVLSSMDIANIFAGKISGKQLFKNLTNTAASVAAGTAGWTIGATVGSVIPVVGTFIGGLAGSAIAGMMASKAASTVLDSFIEDDANEMVEIVKEVFVELSEEYLLTQSEVERISDFLQGSLDGNTLKTMFASDDRYEFARELMINEIEGAIYDRPKVSTPSEKRTQKALKRVLEEIYDSTELVPEKA